MSDPFIAALRAQQPGYQAGWGQLEYSGWQDEQLSWKTGCYLGDWSFLMDLEISGPDALRLFSDHTINSYASFPVGKAKHAVFCSSTGKVIVEGVLMRMADDVFRIQSGPAPFVDFIASKGGYDVSTRRIHTFQLQVSGPEALAVCQAVTGEDLTDIRFMHFRPVIIAGCTVYPVRQGMAGEVGFEFHGDDADKAAVEEAILRAGAAHGIRRLGRRTAMINHLEVAFPTRLWHDTPDFLAPEAAGFAEFSVAKWGHGTPASLRGSVEPRNPADLTFSPYELGYAMFDAVGIPRQPVDDPTVSNFPWNSDDTVSFEVAVREGDFAIISDDVELLTGKKPRTLRDLLFANRDSLMAAVEAFGKAP